MATKPQNKQVFHGTQQAVPWEQYYEENRVIRGDCQELHSGKDCLERGVSVHDQCRSCREYVRIYLDYTGGVPKRKPATKTVYLGTLNSVDVDGNAVELEVHHDPLSAATFAVDATFLNQVGDVITSPFNPGVKLHLSEPK